MDIVICDNVVNNCIMLKRAITKHMAKISKKCRITVLTDGEELIRFKEHYDLLFIKNEMNIMDGFKIASEIRRKGGNCLIVFMISSVKEVKKIFDVHGFDYINIPMDITRLSRILEDALIILKEKEKKSITFYTENGIICLNPNDIHYFISESKRRVSVRTNDKRILVKGVLSQIYKSLDSNIFYQSRRDCIINLMYVEKINNNYVVIMKNGDMLPLAQRKKSDFVNKLIII